MRLKVDASNSIKSGNIMVAILLDFSRVFDLLWSDGLLLKLMRLGLKGHILSWIKSFLEDRSSQIKIGNLVSDSYDLENGTPQGSCLSPLLFLIMVNDFPTLSLFSNRALFADDLTIWRSGINIPQIIHHLQEDINIIMSWCNKWGFVINSSKTIGIIFSNKKQIFKPHLTINKDVIKFENKCVLLGITFDSHLTWSSHINLICERAKTRLNLMRSICGSNWGASKNTLLTVYRSLIRPILDYGCIAYESASPSNLKSLDTIQYKALLLVTGGLKGVALSTLLSECGEIPLGLRRREIKLKYLIKLKLNPSNPTQAILHSKTYPALNMKFDSDFIDDVNKFLSLQDFQLAVPPVVKLAPWRCKGLTVDTTLHKNYGVFISRNANFVYSAQDITNYLSSNYTNHVLMYVDCSKSIDGKVGIGLFIPSMNISISLRLSDHLLTYSGELLAISTGIRYGLDNKIQKLVIVSDCLGVVKDLSFNHSTIRPLFISSLREEIHISNLNVSLVWVPSHLGLIFHEMADQLSKHSLTRDIDVQISYEIKDAESRVQDFIGMEWKNTWKKIQTGLSYKNVFDLLDKGSTVPLKPRSKEIAISRLRIQSCSLNAYLFKIGLHASGLCSSCGTPETVEHFILLCANNKTLQFNLQSSCKALKVQFNLKNCLTIHQLQDIVYKYIVNNNIRV